MDEEKVYNTSLTFRIPIKAKNFDEAQEIANEFLCCHRIYVYPTPNESCKKYIVVSEAESVEMTEMTEVENECG